MRTEYTYDDYLNSLEHLRTSESDECERCPYCGDQCHYEEMDEYKGERMCLDCVEIERTNDAEKSLTPNYSELFKSIA